MKMTLKSAVVLLILTHTLSAISVLPNCSEEWDDSDPDNSGCRTCADGFYSKETAPPSQTPNAKKKWSCFSCPRFAKSCVLDKRKVKISLCFDSFYIDTHINDDDTCEACPDKNSLECKKEDGKIVITKCVQNFYPLPLKVQDDLCKLCPDKSLECYYDKNIGKIVITKCLDNYYPFPP